MSSKPCAFECAINTRRYSGCGARHDRDVNAAKNILVAQNGDVVSGTPRIPATVNGD
jgi:transposase